ncbi:MAG: hypothetical protein E7486_07240, partial [Ruminococcaceae bacterium]|nr:hypothetical protein [Oscillospiraceae bacterium]
MSKASKWIALLSAAALIGSVFAGCGEGESETQSTGATSSTAASQTESTATEESSQAASQGTTSAEVESTASQAQGTASDSASTTSKPAATTSKPATTSSSTSSKAPDKVIQIPVDVKWALDPTLSYENIIPTADGKNWIAISEDGHKLINITGKVLLSAYQIR